MSKDLQEVFGPLSEYFHQSDKTQLGQQLFRKNAFELDMCSKKKSALRGDCDRTAPCGRPALREIATTITPLIRL
jgi:hypothetical protein